MEKYIQLLPTVIMIESFLASVVLLVYGKYGSAFMLGGNLVENGGDKN